MGPRSSTFSRLVYVIPPHANATMPITIRMMPIIPAGFIDSTLKCAASGDQLDNQHHNSDDEQQMNQSTAKVTDESKQPQHQQNDNYFHSIGLFLSVIH